MAHTGSALSNRTVATRCNLIVARSAVVILADRTHVASEPRGSAQILTLTAASIRKRRSSRITSQTHRMWRGRSLAKEVLRGCRRGDRGCGNEDNSNILSV